MRQSKILGWLTPCLVLLGFAACAQSDPEPPLTPASYTHTPTSKVPRSTRAAPSRHMASRPARKAQSLAEATPGNKAPAPVVTGTEGDDSRTAITLARCQRETRCKNVGEEREYVTEEDCITRLEPNTERELEAGDCSRRISPAPLGACMEAIRKESCDSPRELVSIEECNAAALCSKP